MAFLAEVYIKYVTEKRFEAKIVNKVLTLHKIQLVKSRNLC